MANGSLGKAMSVANGNVLVYTVPSNAQFATVSVNLVNNGTIDAKVTVFIGTSSTPTAMDAVDIDVTLTAKGGGLSRTCVVCSPGEHIIVKSTTADVAIRAYGLEQL